MLRSLLLLGLVITAAGCAADTSDDEDERENEPSAATDQELRSAVNCNARAVTGYRSGSPYSMTVVTVGSKPTSKATAHAFLKWQAAADRAGVSLSINSGFRTMAEQQHLYSCYQTKSCNNGNIAARPGYSNHQNGEALDLSTSSWSWVSRTASQFGFRATVAAERWHYEYHGADPGGICSGASSTASASTSDGVPAPTPRPATGADDDDPTPPPGSPSGGGCNSATLGKSTPEGSCVQSSSTDLWYQCHDSQWFRFINGKPSYGTCTDEFPL